MSTTQLDKLPDKCFAYKLEGVRYLPYMDEEGKIDKQLLVQSFKALHTLNLDENAKAQARGVLLRAARKANMTPQTLMITPNTLATMSDDELWEVKLTLNAAPLSHQVLIRHIMLHNEMKARGVYKSLDEPLDRETDFWVKEHPAKYSTHIYINEVHRSLPPSIKPGTTAYLKGTIVEAGRAGPDNKIRLHIMTPYDSETKNQLIHGIMSNRVRDTLEIDWDTSTPNGLTVKAYDDGELVHTKRTFYPDENMGANISMSLTQFWGDVSDEPTIILHPTHGGPYLDVHKNGLIVKVYKDGQMTKHGAVEQGARLLNASSCIVKVEVNETLNSIILYDVDMVNGEQIYNKTYGEKLPIISELVENSGWSIPEFIQTSTKSVFDKRVKQMLEQDTVTGVVYRSHIPIMITKDADLTISKLPVCGWGNDGDICGIKKAAEYPITCGLADSYRCTYLKSIFYDEEEVQ